LSIQLTIYWRKKFLHDQNPVIKRTPKGNLEKGGIPK